MSDNDSDRDPENGMYPLWQAVPDLDSITYSHDATVAAIKDYMYYMYEFLPPNEDVSLPEFERYINEDDIAIPPESGWPDMDVIRELGKTDEVINLLRHIPYRILDLLAPSPKFKRLDPANLKIGLREPKTSPQDVILRVTEENWEYIAPYVVGLVNFQMLLDTRLRVVYFIESDATPCPTRKAASTNELYEVIKAEPSEYVLKEEGEWRRSQGRCAWETSEFFSMLEHHFRAFNYIPIRRWGGWEVFEDFDREEDLQEWQPAVIFPRVREIFREHGWPDLEPYRKDECAEAVERVVGEHMKRTEDG